MQLYTFPSIVVQDQFSFALNLCDWNWREGNAQLPSLTSKTVMVSAGSSDLGVRRFSVTHSLLL
jgi:hypothetical protein